MLATNVRPQRNPTAPQAQRLSDVDILEAIEGAYEYGVWAADMGLVDFDLVAPLSRVIQELRDRRSEAAA